MKTRLNNTTVVITLNNKEMENLEGTNLSFFVTKMFVRFETKYPQYRWHGKWGMKDNKITFFCEKKLDSFVEFKQRMKGGVTC